MTAENYTITSNNSFHLEVVDREGHQIHGIQELEFRATVNQPNVATIRLVSVAGKYTAERAVFQMLHPFLNKWTDLKRIEFADGAAFDIVDGFLMEENRQ
jgi:hypothetical protein